MNPEELAGLAAAIFIIALLYSCVGHAGASGYIAVMSLFGLAPAVIKPTALTLNILVACIGTFQFWRAGHFSWPLFWPFAVLAMPMAFLGGYISLPTPIFKIIIGFVLLFSAARFLLRPPDDKDTHAPAKPLALTAGAALGFFAGLTGTGGGIFLTPLMLFMRWARTKEAAAVSSLYILANSISGLLGNFSATQRLPPYIWVMSAAAVSGGMIGSYYGSKRFDPKTIKRCLAFVLLIAGVKLILTR